MTPRQIRAYDFIREELATHGIAPTYNELARYLGLASKGGAHRIVDRLVEEGKLLRGGRGGARKLSLPYAADLTTVPTYLLQAELQRRGVVLGALNIRSIPLLGQIGATCAAGECAVGVKPGMMYCRQHWFVLPRDLQDALKMAHGRGDLEAFSAAKIQADDLIATWRAGVA